MHLHTVSKKLSELAWAVCRRHQAFSLMHEEAPQPALIAVLDEP